jgi:Flp pilus assembly protein TadG
MLSPMEQTATAPRSPRRDEEGTSLVEFALIVTLLSTLLLGIMVFGILLSKRQVLTQAAAEGARAGVPIQYTTSDQSALTTAVMAQVNKSLQGVSRTCGAAGVTSADGTTCTPTIYSCSGTASPPTAPTGSGDCLQVKVDLTVGGTNPLVPTITLLSPFLPSKMSSTFTVTLANPS